MKNGYSMLSALQRSDALSYSSECKVMIRMKTRVIFRIRAPPHERRQCLDPSHTVKLAYLYLDPTVTEDRHY